MRIAQRIAVGASIAFGVIGAGVVAAAPASAAPAYCPSGYSCTWGDVGYSTSGNTAATIKFQQYIPDFSGWKYAGTAVNGGRSASSIWNNGNTEDSFFYKSINKSGASFRLARGTGDSNMHDSAGVPGGYQDSLMSGFFRSFN